jgi:hypothetical protein
MTTKYLVNKGTYTNIYGTAVEYITDKIFDTEEEAIAYGKATAESAIMTNGNFKVVKKTIDEATFTVEEKEVYFFDYYIEIKIEEEIETLRNKKVKTDKQREKVEKEIAELEEVRRRGLARARKI